MGKFIDLTGQQFNRWKVLEYNGGSEWLCECQCENHTLQLINGNILRSGRSKGCRKCMYKNGSSQLKDISGQKFGELTAIEYVGNFKWKCLCSCGKYTEVRRYDLEHGKTRSCGDRKKHSYSPSNFVNLVNKQFGDRVVLKYDGYDSNTEKSYWICRCACGKVERVTTQVLKNTPKCNHNNIKYIDITGQKFGKLTVTGRLENGKWICKCDCGRNTLVNTTHSLKIGQRTSCGCNIQTKLDKQTCIKLIESFISKYNCKPSRIEMEEIFGVSKSTVRKYIERYDLNHYIDNKFRSRQERYIAKYFIDHSIEIETNRRDIVKGYEIDIFIPSKNIAIEFNGNYWHSELYKDRYYHQNKSLECIRNNIELIHIFEYDFDRIDEILDSILNNSYGNTIYFNGESKKLDDIDSIIENGNENIKVECTLYTSLITRLTNLGFSIDEIKEPKYVWLDSKYNKITDNILSDNDMYENGCCKIYDAGSIVMKLNHNKIY